MASVQKIMRETRADVVVLDADEEPVLLVEVKATRRLDPEVYRETVKIMRERAELFAIPYFMLVDLSAVRVFRRGSTTPDLELPSETVLATYEADFAKKPQSRIYHPYLERLVESWLVMAQGRRLPVEVEQPTLRGRARANWSHQEDHARLHCLRVDLRGMMDTWRSPSVPAKLRCPHVASCGKIMAS